MHANALVILNDHRGVFVVSAVRTKKCLSMQIPHRIISLGNFIRRNLVEDEITALMKTVDPFLIRSGGSKLLNWLRTFLYPKRRIDLDIDKSKSLGLVLQMLIDWINAETPVFEEKDGFIHARFDLDPEMMTLIAEYVRSLPRPKPTI